MADIGNDFFKWFKAHLKSKGIAFICVGILCWGISCEKGDLHQSSKTKIATTITVIESEAHFNGILEAYKNRLLLFEFYADWCAPCKVLEPLLEELAEKHKKNLSIYKINSDYNRKLSNLFKIQGLPYVAFVKNKVIIHSILGLHPKKTYAKAIERYLRQ
jgi:thioredoxin-like negative regulator of GroEL